MADTENIIPLWTNGSMPCAAKESGDERFENEGVYNVRKPVLLARPAPVKANGAAVIVMPGGGYNFLSIVKEGHEVAPDRGLALPRRAGRGADAGLEHDGLGADQWVTRTSEF